MVRKRAEWALSDSPPPNPPKLGGWGAVRPYQHSVDALSFDMSRKRVEGREERKEKSEERSERQTMNQDEIDLAGAEILIVDDQLENLKILRQTLESKGYQVSAVPSGAVALEIARQVKPDLILLDVLMPGMDGFETCGQLKKDKTAADTPIIFITAKDDSDSVIEGFEVGAVDYITKPFREKEVLIRVETHLKNARLAKALLQKNRELQREIDKREQAENALKTVDGHLSIISQQEAERWGIPGFVAKSQMMAKIMGDIRKLHNYDKVNVLITGESGTGKEMIARALHFGGSRKNRHFEVVNCGAIPSQLAESALFGRVKGAFTGADRDRRGAFELAASGTLFLDEIGDMPYDLQVKLLRVLQFGTFTPVGSDHEKHVDVRILAATNADLQAKIADGEFREDLYFRLSEFEVYIPPLRERAEDIPLLADHFLNRLSTEMGIETPTLTPDALSALMAHPFPGNVRQLQHIIVRALIDSDGTQIQPEHLHFTHRNGSTCAPISPADSSGGIHASSLLLNLKDAEALLIQRALEATDGHATEAARLLGH